MNKSNLLAQFLSKLEFTIGSYWLWLLLALLISTIRYFDWNLSLVVLLSILPLIGLFTLGALLGLLTFAFEAQIGALADRIGGWLAKDERSWPTTQSSSAAPTSTSSLSPESAPTAVSTAAPVSLEMVNKSHIDQTPSNTQVKQKNWFRQITILVILPIVALYLLTSSRSALGHGFLFGLSSVYFRDIWLFSRNRWPGFTDVYLGTNQTWKPYFKTILGAYSVYFFGLIIALLIF